jgi:hypothetical protein
LLLQLLLLAMRLLLLLIVRAGLGGLLLAVRARPTSPAWVVSLLPAYSCCCHGSEEAPSLSTAPVRVQRLVSWRYDGTTRSEEHRHGLMQFFASLTGMYKLLP